MLSVYLLLRRNANDPTATSPWSPRELDLLHGVIPFTRRSSVSTMLWRHADQIKVVHDRIVADCEARGETIPDLFRGSVDSEMMQKITDLYSR